LFILNRAVFEKAVIKKALDFSKAFSGTDENRICDLFNDSRYSKHRNAISKYLCYL